MFNLLGIIILPSSSNCHNDDGSGDKSLLAFYLALNAICIIIYLFRIFHWFFIKNKIKRYNTFFDFVFCDLAIMSIFFIIINSFAFIFLISYFILKFLN
jgi:hypothetical protein